MSADEHWRSCLDEFLERRPWIAFLLAMQHVQGRTLVDAGCGPGTYGPLVRQWYPEVGYEGFDLRKGTIEDNCAKWTDLTFFVADMLTFDYSPYDIVLVSGVLAAGDTGLLEEDWPILAARLIETCSGDLILHRVATHEEEFILSMFGIPVVYRRQWGTQATCVLRR